MADEDPFSVFSDDEDDTDSPEQVIAAEKDDFAKALKEKANAKILQSQATMSTKATDEASGKNMIHNETSMDLSHLQPLTLDCWPDPAYLGPVQLVSALEVGGGRGYVALRVLEPGTLVLVEEPAMSWPDAQIGRKLDLISVKKLLEMHDLLHDAELLHPTKEQVDNCADDKADSREQIQKMMDSLSAENDSGRVSELVELAAQLGVNSKDGTPLTSNDILRLFLVCRYNGLESGLYRHVAMLNHDCRPNCTKIYPEKSKSYSEVRTTRKVYPGESLTISYVPQIMSHASRRKYLWEQHRFDIGAELKGNALKMELVGNDLPKSHVHKWDEDSITHRIENAIAELEKLFENVKDDTESGLNDANTLESLKALEQASLELYRESVQQLKNEFHILLIPILALHSETCQELHKSPKLPLNVHLGILSRQVKTLHLLIRLKISDYGSDHFDLASTYLDLANVIGELLSRSPGILYQLDQPSIKTFGEWSAFERQTREEYKRIKNLYPHDAEMHVRKPGGKQT